jgi:tetratricopeptide (TPR) repeat protein
MKDNHYIHVYWKYILALVLIVFAVHGISLRDHFVNWDDEMMVINNPRIMNLSIAGILHVFNPRSIFADRFTEYYPIRDLSYMIDYFIWGLNPLGYHLSNLLFEIANVILVFILFQKLFDDRTVSVLSALVFAVHPLTAGVVSWVSCRKDLMAMTFYLIAFIYFVDFYRTKKANEKEIRSTDAMMVISEKFPEKYLIFASIMFTVAIFSKASALPFPGVIIAYMFIVEDEKRIGKYIKYLAVPVIIMIAYALYSYSYTSYFETGTLRQSYGWDWVFMFFPELFVIYTVRFLLPFNLAALYIEPGNSSLLEPLFLISFLFIALIVYLFFKYIRKDKILFFGFAWIFLNMVPASNIISIQIKIADRFTYIALAGFGLFLARVFQIAAHKAKGISFFVAAISIASFAVISFMLNLTWYSGVTLWAREIQTRPYMPGVNATLWGYAMLGQAYRQEGDYDNALKYTHFVLSIDPDYFPSLKEMADIYAHDGNYEEGIRMYKQALKNDLYKSTDYIVIAQMYEKVHKYREAIHAYEMAERVPHPTYNDKGLDLRIKKLKDLINEK